MDITQFYLAIIVGLVFSLVVEETVGIVCGGAIVCGYLALVCDDPLSVVIILLIALLTYFIVDFILPKFMILFGKRRFTACILVSLLLKVVSDILVPGLPFATVAYRGAGVLVPGLIANTSLKQGLHITIPAVLVGGAATYGIIQLIMLVL